MDALKQTLRQDLARADAIIQEANNKKKRLHQPTVENFTGQALAYRRTLALLDTHPLPTKEIVVAVPWKTLTTIVIVIWLSSKFLF